MLADFRVLNGGHVNCRLSAITTVCTFCLCTSFQRVIIGGLFGVPRRKLNLEDVAAASD